MNASAVPAAVALSVVIPVYNEEANLPVLFARLYPVLDGLGRPYEVVFTNDGSADRSFALLQAQHAARPDVTRVIDFNANYGQHMAIMAAFERVRGDVIVTLDADLQNPPEEIRNCSNTSTPVTTTSADSGSTARTRSSARGPRVSSISCARRRPTSR